MNGCPSLLKNKYRREISNNNLWETFRKDSGEYDFDEEGGNGEQHTSLVQAHILNQQNECIDENTGGGGTSAGGGGSRHPQNGNGGNNMSIQHEIMLQSLLYSNDL